MSTSITLTRAKAQLSACVRAAEHGDAFIITRHGKPVAAIVASSELERLLRLRQAGPEGGLASLADGWEGSDDLVSRLDASRRSPVRAAAPTA